MSLKISIITPSYNQGQFIEQTILSILGQNYPNLEYLVIDGGSTDNTCEILKNYEQHINYWISEKDNGQSEAINKGFKKSTGDILMWLNSDDLLMPYALHKIAKLAENNSPKIWFGNCILFSEQQGVSASGTNVVFDSNTYELENADFIIQPSSFWNRKAWELVGEVNEQLYYTMDWEWYLRAKKSGVEFLPIEDCLSMYRIHAAHKSSSGGTRRQKEICSIITSFNSSKEILYQQLTTENILTSKNMVYRLISKIAAKRNKYGIETVLKIFKHNKYKNYSLKEIHSIKSML